MSSVNKVILVGRLGKDPEIKFFPSGQRYANFSVATSETRKDKNTLEKKERTEWHNVTVTNEALVSVVENYLHKGSRVYLEGQLQTRKWTDTKTGIERYSTDVIVARFRGELTLIDSKQESEINRNNLTDYHETSVAPQEHKDFSGQTMKGGEIDDEIPW